METSIRFIVEDIFILQRIFGDISDTIGYLYKDQWEVLLIKNIYFKNIYFQNIYFKNGLSNNLSNQN